MEDINIISGK
jgi:hypothetical protein